MRRSLLLVTVLAACESAPEPQPPPILTKPAPASAPTSQPTSAPASTPVINAAAEVTLPPLDAKAAALQIKKLTKRKYGKDVPKWAKTPLKLDEKKRVILAVGVSPAGKMNLQLARDTAENRARAMIVKLREGHAELDPDPFSGTLRGARMIDSFTSKKDGNIYVLVEAPLE